MGNNNYLFQSSRTLFVYLDILTQLNKFCLNESNFPCNSNQNGMSIACLGN